MKFEVLVCEVTLVRGLVFESRCNKALFDSSIDACLSTPE